MSIFVFDKFELEENRGEERREKESIGEHRIVGGSGREQRKALRGTACLKEPRIGASFNL